MLKRSRWLLLKRPEKLTGEQRGRLAELVRRNLRTVRAYLLKEDFQSLWGYVSPYWAGQFLDRWCTRTMRSRLDPMKEVARMVALAPRPDSELVPSGCGSSSSVAQGLLRAARQELLDPSKAWWGGRRGRLADRRCCPLSVSLGVVPLVLACFVEVPVRIEVAAGS